MVSGLKTEVFGDLAGGGFSGGEENVPLIFHFKSSHHWEGASGLHDNVEVGSSEVGKVDGVGYWVWTVFAFCLFGWHNDMEERVLLCSPFMIDDLIGFFD